MHAEACKNIQRHQLEGETFYIVDLGNVLRMYKVIPQSARRVLGLSTAPASPHHTTLRHPSVTPNPTKCLSTRASCNPSAAHSPHLSADDRLSSQGRLQHTP